VAPGGDSSSSGEVSPDSYEHADHLFAQVIGAGAWAVEQHVLLGDKRGEVVEQGRFVILDEQVVGVPVVEEDDALVGVEPGTAFAGFRIRCDVGERRGPFRVKPVRPVRAGDGSVAGGTSSGGPGAIRSSASIARSGGPLTCWPDPSRRVSPSPAIETSERIGSSTSASSRRTRSKILRMASAVPVRPTGGSDSTQSR
jgi:hypothetical protein